MLELAAFSGVGIKNLAQQDFMRFRSHIPILSFDSTWHGVFVLNGLRGWVDDCCSFAAWVCRGETREGGGTELGMTRRPFFEDDGTFEFEMAWASQVKIGEQK
jgi:hypothetical protein